MNQTPQQVPHLRFAMLTYGALDATRRCVSSLRRTTPGPFELYVVDNGSTDGTREWLAAQTEPWLSHRNNARNRGVPGGRNDLLDFVLPQAAPTDWIVFIDNDLEFAAGWLDPFLAAMQQFPDARVLGKVGHLAVVDGERRHLCPAPGDTQHVDVVSGGFACFVRADAARAIGRFDEDLGLFWHEDDDWCVRALQLGLDVVAVPAAAIVHHEHASGVATPDLENGGSLHNQRRLAAKWRTLGAVDRDGWIVRRRGPWLPPAVRDEVARRCARTSPIGRLEFAAALSLLEALVEQPDPAGWLDSNRRPVPTITAALTALHAESARAAGDADLAAQLDRVAAALPRANNAALLRPMLRTPGDEVDAPAGQGLCRSRDFADADMLRLADAMGLGALTRDPFARSRALWEQLAVARHVDRAGLAAGARLLWAGDDQPVLRAWLGRRGLTVLDVADAHELDAVLLFRRLDPDDVADLLRHTHDTALVVFVGDATLNGAPSGDVPQPHQLELDLLARAGLTATAPIAVHSDEEVLEACRLRADDAGTPQLSELEGTQVRTSFVVAARRTPAPAPSQTLGPVLIPAAPMPRPRLRVGIDLRTLAQADSTARGIGKYTEQHLAALAAAAPDVQFVGYVGDLRDRLPAALRRANFTTRALDDYREQQVDLVHVPDPMNMSFGFDSPLRVLRHPKTTVTFHDLTPLHHYVRHWPRRNREAYHDRLRQLVQSDCELLTNSVFTAEDLIRHTGVDRARVTPILAGLHHGDRPAPATATIAAVQHQLGVRQPFVLHVGAHDPHKNFHAVLSAFLLARSARPLQLVVVGAVDPGVAQAAAWCAARKLSDVVFTGYLPRRHLDALYASATATLFLSRAEGFGFPILEAMARGCPVIASAATSHPEVAGDAALLVGADDRAAAAAGIGRLLDDSGFAASLRRLGQLQARRFPWSAVAERTLAVWRRLATSTAARDVATPAPQLV
ncbi:MAG: glycosyltransferase [Planctomycetes bacterium]|nr:glycosyltransferase [Planctomycetota bacterium]